MRRFALVASLLAALVAGVLAGRAPHDPAPAAPLLHLDAARTGGRAALAAATTPQAQRAAALRLAGAYRTAQRAAAAQLRPALANAAGAYTDLADATGDRARFGAARARIDTTEALLSLARSARPSGPAHWPAVPFALIAVALALGATRRRKICVVPDPRPRFRYTPSSDFAAWDASGPGEPGSSG